MISLKPETQQMIEERMQKGGFGSADDLVRTAIETLDQVEAADLDQETIDAIEEAEAEYARGEGRPWEEVREELHRKGLATKCEFRRPAADRRDRFAPIPSLPLQSLPDEQES